MGRDDNTMPADMETIHDMSEIDPMPDVADYMPLQAGDITLESILAEYKGSAYIDGDKKTPSAILQEKTEKIVMEAAGGHYSQTSTNIETSGSLEAEKTKPLPSLNEMKAGNTKPLPSLNAMKSAKEAASVGKNDKKPREHDSSELHRKSVIPFDKVAASENNNKNMTSDVSLKRETAGAVDHSDMNYIGSEVEAAIERQAEFEDETQRSARKLFGLFNRHHDSYDENELDNEFEDHDAEPDVPVIEEEIVEEPDYRAAIKRFAAKCNLYSLRSFVSTIITLVMAVLTVIYQADVSAPFGMAGNRVVNTGVLMIILLIVMIFSIDHLVNGLLDLLKGKTGIDTLNLFSCIATIASGAYTMITKDTNVGVPFCVVSAFSLSFTLWGEKIYYRALTETMKTALSVGTPYGVISEISRDLDKTIIKKVSGRTAGFYNNLVQADISEMVYQYATPILIVASIVLGFYSSFGTGQGHYFLHNFAAVMAAAAPFSAIFAYAVPLSMINKSARPTGATIAGWGGADDLVHSDGASITDDDLFPQGTISLSGIKIFEEVSPEKALRYTASLIVASNSGLSKVFTDMLYKQGMTMMHVEEFTCYEGGIGGTIRGERIYTGSGAFMNLQGIRVPGSLNNKNAIFTAINKKLIAVFTVEYTPVKNVQNALISMLYYRVKLFFAIRDFNITPVMLEQKFKVSIDNVEYIPVKDSYDISDDAKQEAKRVSAVLTREGVGPYVEAITGGRRLRTTALIATICSLISAVGGMIIMFAICWTGTFSAGSAGNLMLYMLSMLFVCLIFCGFARYRR